MSDTTRPKETPLTVEALLRVLQSPGIRGVGGYNGSCEAFPRIDELIDRLQQLLKQEGKHD